VVVTTYCMRVQSRNRCTHIRRTDTASRYYPPFQTIGISQIRLPVYDAILSPLSRNSPMADPELLPSLTNADKSSVMQYQRKMGSLLYAAITTRPDIALAVSRLARFNQNPSEEHQRAADRVIQFLYHTRSGAICYGGGDQGEGARSFVYASDASFADNTIDRKSSRGYIMTLFGGPIAWRANKQDTVTTRSCSVCIPGETGLWVWRKMEAARAARAD
jgi:hypothetical protein